MTSSKRKRIVKSDPNAVEPCTAALSALMGMAIRNQLEEIHGGGIEDSLTDAQMAKINPIIRNSIATVFHAIDHPEIAKWQQWLDFQQFNIPPYWEPARLLTDDEAGIRPDVTMADVERQRRFFRTGWNQPS